MLVVKGSCKILLRSLMFFTFSFKFKLSQFDCFRYACTQHDLADEPLLSQMISCLDTRARVKTVRQTIKTQHYLKSDDNKYVNFTFFQYFIRFIFFDFSAHRSISQSSFTSMCVHQLLDSFINVLHWHKINASMDQWFEDEINQSITF